ncbi:methyl-accepting chemotaxis protein [Paenibacillus sp. Marseille-Q4541]|uniref:methyl-accepting chemotaxis protein n=1 Tax=Paenibacillus sp. Marseille-Q4541 TaxID=2831522 RepID=UPI002019B934|nr:methyl-accepting chemotaxis protein [Paenibacillus sp. Marseille-Q4541]
MKGFVKLRKKRDSEEGSQTKKKGERTRFSWKRLNNLNPIQSVGVRLFLIFMIAILLVVFGLGTLSYQTAKATIKDNAATANQETMEQITQRLDIIMERYVDMSTQIFFDTNIQKNLTDLTKSGVTEFEVYQAMSLISEQMMNMQFTNKTVASIALIHQKPEVPIISTGASAGLSELRNEEWFKALLEKGGIQWLPTVVRQDGSEDTYRMARVLKNISTSIGTYVLVFDIKASALETELKKVDFGESGVIQTIAEDGTVVGSSISDRAGKKSELSFINDLTEQSGFKDTENTIEGQHREVLAVYNTLGISGWKMIGMIPVDELLKGANKILIVTVIFAVAAAILALLIGIWMVRMIATPLSRLKDLMYQGAKGDLTVRTSHHSKDEIGQLSASFNQMMEQITDLVKQTNQTAQDVLHTASELSSASQKTAASATEVAVATEQIAGGATNLASEAERGSEMTEQISAQMQKVVVTNEELGSSAREVEGASQEGSKYLTGLISKTEQSEEMIRSLVHKVDQLKDSTSSILSILDVLHNIARQTNILSLNATIEAARAGVAGRGFMVVAGEVRQLADQSKESIDMVASMTDRIMNEMNETVAALSEAYPLFQEQIVAVKETGEIFQTVEDQMGHFVKRLNETSVSIEALNESQITLSETMMNVSSVAEQSSATSQEVASLSSEQQSIGNHLVELSAKLEKVSGELKSTLSAFHY